MRKQSWIPATHYDFVKRWNHQLFDALNTDLAHVRNEFTLDQAPFSSVDDYSVAYEDYIAQRLLAMKEAFRSRIMEHGHTPSDTELDYHFGQIPTLSRDIHSLSIEYHTLFNFMLFGEKVFHFSDGLVGNLAHTALDAPSEYLRLPFPSCMFLFTSDKMMEALNRFTKTAPLDSHAPISVFLYDRDYEDGRKLVIVAYHSKGQQVHGLVKRELFIHPDWSLEQSLHTDWNKLYEAHKEWNDTDVPSVAELTGLPTEEEPFYEEGLDFFRIIINSILYLSSNDPDIVGVISPTPEYEGKIASTKSNLKKKKLRKQAKRFSALDGVLVGNTVQPILVDKTQRPGKVPSASAGDNKLHKRIQVRGHWRNQACGKNREDRKLIYIKPFFKGPEMAELVHKPYVVRQRRR